MTPINLSGIFVPWIGGQPIFLKSSDGLILPLFTTLEKYQIAAKWGDFQHAQCIRVTDNDGFFKTVGEMQKRVVFKIACDPYLNEKGNTCFNLIKLEKKDES